MREFHGYLRLHLQVTIQFREVRTSSQCPSVVLIPSGHPANAVGGHSTPGVSLRSWRPVATAAGTTSLAIVLSAILSVTLLIEAKPAGSFRSLSVNLGLLASETFIMTGTAMPVVTPQWMSLASGNFVTPTTGTDYTHVSVTLPNQLWPVTGLNSLSYNNSTQQGAAVLDAQIHALIADNTRSGSPDDPIVVFGYSQSAQISSIEKKLLQDEVAAGALLPPITFVLMANPLRPNGGLAARLTGFMTPWTPVVSAPTDTPFQTYDIARQYDLFADFPTQPLLHPIATVNAVFGFMNHNYGRVTLDPASPNYDPNTVVQQHGDTTYYLIPAQHLPILAPLRLVGMGAVADAVEPMLRVLVELGYDRTTPYGQHTTVGRMPNIDAPTVLRDPHVAFSAGAVSARAWVTGVMRPPIRKLSSPTTADPKLVMKAAPGARAVRAVMRAARAAPAGRANARSPY